jgi:hypothetical protein
MAMTHGPGCLATFQSTQAIPTVSEWAQIGMAVLCIAGVPPPFAAAPFETNQARPVGASGLWHVRGRPEYWQPATG